MVSQATKIEYEVCHCCYGEHGESAGAHDVNGLERLLNTMIQNGFQPQQYLTDIPHKGHITIVFIRVSARSPSPSGIAVPSMVGVR